MQGYQFHKGAFYPPGHLPPGDDFIEISQEQYDALIHANHQLGHDIVEIDGKVISRPRVRVYTAAEVKEAAPSKLSVAAATLGWGDTPTLLTHLLDDSIPEATEAAKKFIAYRKRVYADIAKLGDANSQEDVLKLFEM